MNKIRIRKQQEPASTEDNATTFPLLIFREKSDQDENQQPVKWRNKKIQEFGYKEKHSSEDKSFLLPSAIAGQNKI